MLCVNGMFVGKPNAVKGLSYSGGLFSHGGESGVSDCVVGAGLLFVCIVVVVLVLLGVYVGHSSSGVFVVVRYANVCEYGFFKGSRESHPHAISIVVLFAILVVGVALHKVGVNGTVALSR